MKRYYDVVIIGSGFGGSITAYRLAAAQKAAGKEVSVCVLERGKRFHRGEFPRDLGKPKDWWWKEGGSRGWKGLMEFRAFDHISVLVGSGVGGTSLIYLDVQIDAAATTGAADRFRLLDLAIYWGKQGSEPGVLNQDPYGRGGPPQVGCAYCGECFLGCNTHSKNTVDLNYLWLAQRLGAEVYSQHSVVKIEQNPAHDPIH